MQLPVFYLVTVSPWFLNLEILLEMFDDGLLVVLTSDKFAKGLHYQVSVNWWSNHTHQLDPPTDRTKSPVTFWVSWWWICIWGIASHISSAVLRWLTCWVGELCISNTLRITASEDKERHTYPQPKFTSQNPRSKGILARVLQVWASIAWSQQHYFATQTSMSASKATLPPFGVHSWTPCS